MPGGHWQNNHFLVVSGLRFLTARRLLLPGLESTSVSFLLKQIGLGFVDRENPAFEVFVHQSKPTQIISLS